MEFRILAVSFDTGEVTEEAQVAARDEAMVMAEYLIDSGCYTKVIIEYISDGSIYAEYEL